MKTKTDTFSMRIDPKLKKKLEKKAKQARLSAGAYVNNLIAADLARGA